MLSMDNSSSTPTSVAGSTGGSVHGSVTGSTDEVPRVKFLCSFLGSILPRPQDGRLRYVGGETRIVSVPRDICYEELMNRMKELYEGAAMLKYQQPDEDLDALVSVVNDDDVTNMMEEYDKLGSGDGCTRLRIFLFLHPDLDGSMTYVDGDDWETERRYVDALNNLNEGFDAKKCDSPVVGPDETLLAEQFFNAMSFDGGPQRSGEFPIPPYNLHHLNVPHIDPGHIQPSVHQRFNEIEGSWGPAYYSPRQQGYHDPRNLSDLPSSPSSTRYRIPFTEMPEKCMDRMPEEYVRQHLNSQASYEQLTQFPDAVGWVPSGNSPGDQAGFPGNILHAHSVYEGNNVGEQHRIAFNRNQVHLEPSNLANGIPQAANACAECHPSCAAYVLNADAKMHHLMPHKEQPIQPAYGDTHYREAGYSLPHQLNSRVEETRVPMAVAGSGRLNDHYVVDGAGMNFPAGQGNFADSHLVHSNYVYHRPSPEFGSEVFHDQVAISSQHMHIPSLEDHGGRYGNYTPPYGGDNVYHRPHGHVHQHALWRNIQNPVHGASSYELSALPQQVNGSVKPAIVRNTMDGAAGFSAGMENQNLWAEPSQKIIGLDGNAVAGQSYAHHSKLKTDPYVQESSQYFTAEPFKSSHDLLDFSTSVQPVQLMDSSSHPCKLASGGDQEPGNNSNIPISKRVEEKVYPEERKEVDHLDVTRSSHVQSIFIPEQKNEADKSKFASNQSSKSNCTDPAQVFDNAGTHGENDPSALESAKLSVNRLSFLPELIASVKKAALEEVEELKVMADDSDSAKLNVIGKTAVLDESEPTNAPGELELDSDNGNHNLAKIEPTKAEEEAISRGLQTIRNDDLEEIRELGSGTYGSVYHGKWKGSDIAIKRIKASCFAGRPSERERLIADFWKEALILSSLHHPNVVSFYGIVRDGPDGSLATVTEFMVNGSLKQFLHKKDRTIDRRKRLIIAMDAAFGMEYLHGKNIVHFDLKCENLLVNMRDPQRPVCKIGDLGLSKVRQHTLVSGGVRGTLPWMAPELLSGKSNMVTEKIDVYSFGIVMWELLSGEEPYADMHCASIIGGIVNNTLRPKIPSWCDPEWRDLMEKCWSSDPAERPSFSEISQKLRTMAAAINVK